MSYNFSKVAKFTCYMLIFNFFISVKHEQYTAGSVNHLILSIRIY